jgi:hypothetical protein
MSSQSPSPSDSLFVEVSSDVERGRVGQRGLDGDRTSTAHRVDHDVAGLDVSKSKEKLFTVDSSFAHLNIESKIRKVDKSWLVIPLSSIEYSILGHLGSVLECSKFRVIESSNRA